jgi:hypothetical protein
MDRKDLPSPEEIQRILAKSEIDFWSSILTRFTWFMHVTGRPHIYSPDDWIKASEAANEALREFGEFVDDLRTEFYVFEAEHADECGN